MADSIVKVENVEVYQRDIMVLKEVSLEVNEGDFIYFVGKTGSGKSSLMRVLYADLPLKKGFVRVNGMLVHKLKNKNIPKLRRSLGIVFQDFQLLFDRSVNDNLLFVMKATGWKDKNKMKLAMEKILEQVDLKNKGHKMPHQLSGGEQQRLAIGRALVNNPKVILADEPTGNLDPHTSHGIMDLLMQIKENGTAVIMATHDYDTMDKYPGRIFHFADSTVSEIEDISALK
jgi:cell division transport system ATP-binding protein